MHASKKPNRRHIQPWIAQADGIHRKALTRGKRDLPHDLHIQVRAAQLDDSFQRHQLGKHVQKGV